MSSNGNGKPKRKRGRPGKGNEVIRPEDYPDIAALKGRGWSFVRIAQKYGVHHRAIQETFKRHIWPAQRVGITHPREDQLLKLKTAYSIAYECLESGVPFETKEQVREEMGRGGSQGHADRRTIEKVTSRTKRGPQKCWMDVIVDIIKEESKLLGVYPAKQVEVIHDPYRVAGDTPEETDRVMQKRLEAQILATRKHQEAMKELGIDVDE